MNRFVNSSKLTIFIIKIRQKVYTLEKFSNAPMLFCESLTKSGGRCRGYVVGKAQKKFYFPGNSENATWNWESASDGKPAFLRKNEKFLKKLLTERAKHGTIHRQMKQNNSVLTVPPRARTVDRFSPKEALFGCVVSCGDSLRTIFLPCRQNTEV